MGQGRGLGQAAHHEGGEVLDHPGEQALALLGARLRGAAGPPLAWQTACKKERSA